jgi:uncharacterized phage protein gp47/JayE
MNLPIRSFTTIVRDMSAAITASAGSLIDMSVGSVLRAIIEANAAIVLWVQWLTILTLQTTRAATSTGSDLDSWMADFSLSRLPAAAATGVVTVSRYSATVVAYVPSGTIVKTQDGSVSFSIAVDLSNSCWNATLGAYSLAVGVTAIDVPITAVVAGPSGNVLPNIITLLASPVAGIDLVNNQNATNGGAAAETDQAFRSRFAAWFAARSRATIDAIGYAVSQVQAGLNYVVQENVDAQGNLRPGNILIVVNDGSGILSDDLFDSLSIAVGAVRPVGTCFSIQPPQITQVQVGLAIDCPAELSVSSVQSLLNSAIEDYVNALDIGSALSLTRISQLVYMIEPTIINVSNVTLNGGNVDLASSPTGAFQFTGVTYGQYNV